MSDETTVTPDAEVAATPTADVGGDGPVKPTEAVAAGGEAPPVIAIATPTADVGGDGPVKPNAEVQSPSVLDRIKEILHAFEHQSVTIARELAQKWHDEF